MLRNVMHCALCGGELEVLLPDLWDNRFGSNGAYSIAECGSCGVLQTVPMPDAASLKGLYETYYNFGGETGTRYTRLRRLFQGRWIYRVWMALDGDISFHSRRGRGRLLDVGCNEGRGLLIYRENGFDAEGLELNERAAQTARAAGFTVHTQPLDAYSPEKPYDVLVLSNVLEHSPEPRKMLECVRRLLKPGGRVWISCPNSRSWLRWVFGKSWINWHVPFHLFHFSMESLTRLLRECGLEVVGVQNKTPSHWMAQSMVAWLFAAPGKATRRLRSPLLVGGLMVVCRFGLFPLVWLGNVAGRGDCLVVEGVRS